MTNNCTENTNDKQGFIPFPVDKLPACLRDFIIDGAFSIGCDPSYIALPMLSMLGACIGNSRRLLAKSGYSVPAIIWTVIIGESGTAKSPAIKLVHGPIRQLEKEEVAKGAAAENEFLVDNAKYEKDMLVWSRGKKTDEPPPEKPAVPEALRLVVSDTTIEALAPILRSNQRGLLLARDELSGWIGSFDKYSGKGGADAASWLSMYDAATITIDRKTEFPRTIYVPDPFVCITGGIQPGVLNRSLSEEHRESGMASRLLMTWPPQRPRYWTEKTINHESKSWYEQLVKNLLAIEGEVDARTNEPAPKYVGMTADAKRLYHSYYNTTADELTDLSGDIRAAISKLQEHPLRVGLILHCCRLVEGECQTDTLDDETMSAAIAIAEWAKQEARRVYRMMAENKANKQNREINQWIKDQGGSVTARDLVRGRRDVKSTEQAEKILEALVTAGLGRWENSTPGNRGQPTRRYVSGKAVDSNRPIPSKNCITVDVDNTAISQNGAIPESQVSIEI